jgi:hypothetical protein
MFWELGVIVLGRHVPLSKARAVVLLRTAMAMVSDIFDNMPHVDN